MDSAIQLLNNLGQMFCWFVEAILVDQNGTPIRRFHTKLYKGAWIISANNSKTVGHKDLRLKQIVYILAFYNIPFLGFFHWTVSNLFFFCVIVKTIYNIVQIVWQPTSSFWNTWYHCKEIDEIGSSRWISFKTRRCLQSFLETKSRYGVRMLWSIGIELIFKPWSYPKNLT